MSESIIESGTESVSSTYSSIYSSSDNSSVYGGEYDFDESGGEYDFDVSGGDPISVITNSDMENDTGLGGDLIIGSDNELNIDLVETDEIVAGGNSPLLETYDSPLLETDDELNRDLVETDEIVAGDDSPLLETDVIVSGGDIIYKPNNIGGDIQEALAGFIDSANSM
jgi:hypothetical protein